jgi:Flp pilus assembly protein TadB
MAASFIGVSWFVWAGVAAVLAVAFTVIQIPKQTPRTSGLTHLILRWFHAITWLCLAVSFLVRAVASDQSGVADAIGLLGLAAYIAFRVEIRRTKRLLPTRAAGSREDAQR